MLETKGKICTTIGSKKGKSNEENLISNVVWIKEDDPFKKNETWGYILNICEHNYARNLHNYSPLFPLYLPSSKNSNLIQKIHNEQNSKRYTSKHILKQTSDMRKYKHLNKCMLSRSQDNV